MITNKLMMWSATFSYRWELSEAMLGMSVTMLPDIEMMAMATPAIDSEVVEGVFTPAIGVDMLTANGAAAVMTPLELAFPSP